MLHRNDMLCCSIWAFTCYAKEITVSDHNDDVKPHREPPDLNALARKYMELWQQQLAATADDDTLSKTMADAVRLMSSGAAQMATQSQDYMTAMQTAVQEAQSAHGTPSATDPSSGTAPTGAAHRNDDGLLDECARRIGELEERVRVLERQLSEKSD